VGRLFRDQLHEPLSLLPMQAFDYIGNGPIRTIKTFLHAVKHDMLGRVRGVRIPCLILSGEQDPIAPQRWVEALATRLPQSGLRIVPGAGHALNYNSAPVIAPEIIAFWRSAGIDV
jgi:pimeloyl-ACP methyl ester carboxylesterase